MRFWSALVVLGLALAAGLAAPAAAERRVALVIGNGAYTKVPKLANPTNDAAAIEALLKAARFDKVVRADNLGVAQMRRALRDFSDEVRDADIAVVFYAGHGMEMNGVNYLIPTDAVLERDIDVADETVSLDRINTVLEPAKRLRLVILDACRDNPFVRSMRRTLAGRAIGRGLAPVEVTATDTLFAYAAKAGSTAADGEAANSPYTSALIKHLTTPGLDVRLALGRVRDDVLRTTSRRQEPFVYGSLGGAELPLVPAQRPPVAHPEPPLSAAAREWQDVKSSSNRPVLEAFRKRHQSDPVYAALADETIAKLAAAASIPLPVASPCDGVRVSVTSSGATCIMPGSGHTFQDCIGCPEMVLIPTGTFVMGSNKEYNETPIRKVSFVTPFAMGKFEITQSQWIQCVEAGFCERKEASASPFPIINVSWRDAKVYVEWLSVRTQRKYRLPSEAEWEYVARSGKNTSYWWGNALDSRKIIASHVGRLSAVGSVGVNTFGVADMEGNVSEWIEDIFNNHYIGAPTNGEAWLDYKKDRGDFRMGELRVVRGSNFMVEAQHYSATRRGGLSSENREPFLGFRVARDLP